MDDEDKCLVCLDSINNNLFTYPKHCNCKVKLHLECLNQIEKNKLLCPICRIKSLQNNFSNHNMVHITQIYQEPFIFYFPIYLFFRNPNFFTFMIYLTFSFIITIFYIIPMVLIYGLCDYAYRNKIIYGFATVLAGLYIKSLLDQFIFNL